MRRDSIRRLVLTALLAALTCVTTMAIRIPTPMNGYVHPGDCMVMLSGFLLGPVWGAFAAGFGAMLADLLAGYVYYAPATLVIKAICACCAALVSHLLRHRFGRPISALAGGVVGALPMIGGYFLYEALLLGSGWAAATSIPGNVMQGVFGAAVCMVLVELFEHSSQLRRFLDELDG